MQQNAKGIFTRLDGQDFYKIENFDKMEDFFMTITSSSDVWNFCWSQGGVTAGRGDADHAIFPYYTADKVSDGKTVTGPYTAIAVKDNGSIVFWEPFAPLMTSSAARFIQDPAIQRNIYKNANGTKVWFEEVNKSLGLTFRYGWTSSARFGLVRMTHIENNGSAARTVTVLDGCRNILPACIGADMQNQNSVLLDAYKKTDLDAKGNLALFTLSSVVTDKAEPSEGLLANVSWFTTDDPLLLSPDTPAQFFAAQGNKSELKPVMVVKGERPGCFIAREETLEAGSCAEWYQVFDTFLNASRIAVLKNDTADRKAAEEALVKDIQAGEDLMTTYLGEADGIQETGAKMTCLHHRANVMFNIMRGGFFADNGKINVPDLLSFIATRNKAMLPVAEKALASWKNSFSVNRQDLEAAVEKEGNPQLTRLFMEYLPIIFSRRHGDPSRPWNRFNIKLNDASGNPILNYEGNWRDIFQNWEALTMSYPAYVPAICAKFLNAMTADGFNPYRISREGIDWECPEPNNPWAQYGYWGDHQVIYLQKLLEMWSSTERDSFLNALNDKLYVSSNVPYRLKSYDEICRDPRASILFDKALSDKLFANSKTYGSDAKLVQGKDNQPYLLTFTAKLLQIIICKTANLVPGGGIWMNTQRPEWNDANNALAGYGLSVVTLCYLHRMIKFLIKLYKDSPIASYTLPKAEAICFSDLSKLYRANDVEKTLASDEARKAFTDAAGHIFEVERNAFYTNGYADGEAELSRNEIVEALESMEKMVRQSIAVNRRSDGLYHTYNTLLIGNTGMSVERLQEMLEGQVAVLSAGLLDSAQTLDLLSSLKNSPLFEKRQYSYILYPNKELPAFLDKNNVEEKDLESLKSLLERSEGAILCRDINGKWHFNAEFHNARIMEDIVTALPESKRPTPAELETLKALYEKTFNHQSFTGRSGTFYAYEGLGSIYWHMVSKLLLAVQEHTTAAYDAGEKEAPALAQAYYDVRKGLSFNKTPDLYGAFPSDPYSHTPFGKGARQPGMTGQVKEEVLTRWGELGVRIADGKAFFKPQFLEENEWVDGKLKFTWCATSVTYQKTGKSAISVVFADGSTSTRDGFELTAEETKKLFARDGSIKSITVQVA